MQNELRRSSGFVLQGLHGIDPRHDPKLIPFAGVRGRSSTHIRRTNPMSRDTVRGSERPRTESLPRPRVRCPEGRSTIAPSRHAPTSAPRVVRRHVGRWIKLIPNGPTGCSIRTIYRCANVRHGWEVEVSGTDPSDRFWPKAECPLLASAIRNRPSASQGRSAFGSVTDAISINRLSGYRSYLRVT